MTKPIADIPVPAAPARRERAAPAPAFDAQRVRADFPLLHTSVHGRPLVYLDNAATTQKPQVVIDTIRRYYEAENANIHRGVYTLSQNATDAYERTRRKARQFLNAASPKEIIFTRGATEAINLVASSWGAANLQTGDEVIVSAMEHHSNIVPWQLICERTGARLRVIPINDAGELLVDEYEKLLSERTKLVAVTHLSNALGTINDAKQITQMAHAVGAKVLIDGAQWAVHCPTDVREIGCDFYAFSGHKLFGPTGVGVLYGRESLLQAMPPYQGGGDMIESVTFEKTTYAGLPSKFEAGTPNIAGVIGLGAAIDYVESIGLENVAEHERALLDYATQRLGEVPGLRIVGVARRKASVLSFVLEDPAVSSYEIGLALDREGVAVRTGHHCCQPLMERLSIPATARASLAMYNTREDVDALISALLKLTAEFNAAPKARPSVESASPAVEAIYPEPAAESPEAAAAELIDDFEFLGDWEQRDQYLLDLGEKIPALPASAKSEANRVHGCMSLVHLIARRRPDSKDAMDFLADSDAHIVRGLIAILQRIYSGQSAGKILAFDVEGFLSKLGLDRHLSMGRRNGLEGMIRRIKSLAKEIAQEP